MNDYLGTFEMQPLYDSHQSFHGKASVERWSTEHGTQYVLRSYGSVVAVVTPLGETGEDTDTYRVEVAMEHMSATPLRHVKEFLAQTDDVFKGITLPWLRKAVRDGGTIDGVGTEWRKTYAVRAM